ncbi:hypothetical protein H257_01156 [Aphanomyces astaci]|uniref:Uncharacterized protein n=1 Tax=Aphanomyces astaci TaxID=112090 RepID=W4H6Z7_APHAT|nr:hypothetical protein H257_01156 [Aphanomyces astaci]ETV87657.1 hypothetical protein H257_01156 [Aphanomyces astaci]|eukprot:XP_009822520.1 hypothetical protein H257_01156 [Aphanomyces astaci]
MQELHHVQMSILSRKVHGVDRGAFGPVVVQEGDDVQMAMFRRTVQRHVGAPAGAVGVEKCHHFQMSSTGRGIHGMGAAGVLMTYQELNHGKVAVLGGGVDGGVSCRWRKMLGVEMEELDNVQVTESGGTGEGLGGHKGVAADAALDHVQIAFEDGHMQHEPMVRHGGKEQILRDMHLVVEETSVAHGRGDVVSEVGVGLHERLPFGISRLQVHKQTALVLLDRRHKGRIEEHGRKRRVSPEQTSSSDTSLSPNLVAWWWAGGQCRRRDCRLVWLWLKLCLLGK